jgi:hypothetical protein
MQKLAFARFTGKSTCLFLSQRDSFFGRKPFSYNLLAIRPEVGPLLDNSLKPGARPALAITRKDGR